MKTALLTLDPSDRHCRCHAHCLPLRQHGQLAVAVNRSQQNTLTVAPWLPPAGAVLIACPHDSLAEYFLHSQRSGPAPKESPDGSSETMFQRLSKKSSGSLLTKPSSFLPGRLGRSSKDPAGQDRRHRKRRAPWAPLKILVSSDTAEISAPYNQPEAAEVLNLDRQGSRPRPSGQLRRSGTFTDRKSLQK